VIEAIEDAFHRLDGSFVALSERALDAPRVRLLRALAAQMWRADLDPQAELLAAHSMQPADVLLQRAVAAFVSKGPIAALEPSRHYVEQFPADALAVSLFVWSRLFSAVPGSREEAVQHLRSAVDPTNWRTAPLVAMALQEAGEYDAARRLASRALADEPAAAHAVHVMAHVQYETGEHAAGRRWLEGWNAAHRIMGYDSHFVWHAALHALGEGDVEGALRRFRAGISPTSVADAGTLLWRCRLAGSARPAWARAAVGPARPVIDALPVAFFVFNSCFTLAAAGDADGLSDLARRLARDPRPGFADLVAPVAYALVALLGGDPAAAVALLEPLPPRLPRLGGSHAQREIVEDTLIEALLLAGEAERARRLLLRRLERREHALDRRLLDRAARRAPTPAAQH
jgi:hypothetical protein